MERLTTFADSVLSIVPDGFAAYARVFHPAGDLRWADVAAAAGRVAHPAMQWNAITGADYYALEVPGLFGERPAEGAMPPGVARVLAEVLARHTGSSICWFAAWEGWGGSHATGPFASAPAFEPPHRRYVLARGAVADATESVGFGPADQTANLWWPEDRAWCVATEVDLVTTYVAASEDAVAELLAQPELEAMRIAPSAGVTGESDPLNR